MGRRGKEDCGQVVQAEPKGSEDVGDVTYDLFQGFCLNLVALQH